MSITDDQLRIYLLSTGWAEHPDMPGTWEREDATGVWSLMTGDESMHGVTVAMLAAFEQRPEADIVRDIARTMPMAAGGFA